MSRTLSAAALAAILGQETSEVFVALAELSAVGMDTIRIAANGEDVVSGGDTYSAFPFRIDLPSDSEPAEACAPSG